MHCWPWMVPGSPDAAPALDAASPVWSDAARVSSLACVCASSLPGAVGRRGRCAVGVRDLLLGLGLGLGAPGGAGPGVRAGEALQLDDRI